MSTSIGEVLAELSKKQNPQTVETIWRVLPIKARANIWGDEIYFDIPVAIPLEKHAVEEVEVGTLAYWPTGKAFCIFFGRTPVSTSDKPRAYSPVNVFGRVLGDVNQFKTVANGATIMVTGVDV